VRHVQARMQAISITPAAATGGVTLSSLNCPANMATRRKRALEPLKSGHVTSSSFSTIFSMQDGCLAYVPWLRMQKLHIQQFQPVVGS
jgi:hypothetical protein